MMTTRGVRGARWGRRTSHASPRYSPWTGHGGRSRRAGPRAVFRAVGTPPGPARPRQRGAVHLPPGRPAARVGGVARLHPSHPRAGDPHRLRQPVHRAAGRGVRRRGLLLPAPGPVVLAHQELLLRGRGHADPLLHRLSHPAGRRGGGAGDHDGGRVGVGEHPAARRGDHEAVARREMIQLLNISKRFLDNVVLDGVSLDVQDGETVALLGPSGVGKSVTLKTINGLLKPDSGDVIVDGLHVPKLKRAELQQLRSRVGYVFQYGALFDSDTVAENIRLGITDEDQHRDEAYCRERVKECLRLVNLAPDVADKYPAELSGGMRKRVGIARAIAGKPKYLLYDEPTSGLDPVNADVIDGLVERLRDELGVTSVVVSD